MSFSTAAVAGPSRIPMQTAMASGRSRRAAIHLVRRYASESTESSDTPASSLTTTQSASTFWGSEKTTRSRKIHRTMLWPVWKRQVGKDFERVEAGQKAKWLGGDVPYPMNPTFCPPPPLSDEYQTYLYSEMRKGTKTIGEISAEYNVSKARLEAIKKLKEIEEEFKRQWMIADLGSSLVMQFNPFAKQSIPLQVAFQKGMEPLLGAEDLVQTRWGRNERGDSRDVNQATSAELDEESRWDRGIGAGGAFGERSGPHGERVAADTTTIERNVFEWRAEDDVLASRAAGVSADLFPTPDTEAAARKATRTSPKVAKRAPPEKIVPGRIPTTSWRFVDLSGVGVNQEDSVVTEMKRRARVAEKKQKYKNSRKGVYE